MTDILQRAKESLEDVTEGPWLGYDGWGPFAGDDGRELMEASRIGPPSGTQVIFGNWTDCAVRGTRADMEFILHARTLIPELIAEIERLRGDS